MFWNYSFNPDTTLQFCCENIVVFGLKFSSQHLSNTLENDKSILDDGRPSQICFSRSIFGDLHLPEFKAHSFNQEKYAALCLSYGDAFLQIAITGKGFVKASEIATELIMSNILRIGKVNVIGDVILFLGKLCVSLTSALFAFLMLDTHKYKSAHNKITSPLFPVLVC